MLRHRLAILLLGPLLFVGCSRNLEEVGQPPISTVVTTAGPNHSMIYLARVEGGVIAVDLACWGADRAIEKGLAELDADTGDVVAVFLTHYSDDTKRSRRELAALFDRIADHDVRWACTAHGDCAAYDAAFRADVLGSDPEDDQR